MFANRKSLFLSLIWPSEWRFPNSKRLNMLKFTCSQGFATGDLAEDAWSVRHFFRNTSLEILVAQSFSKNFGLYGERVGALHVVCRTEVARSKVHNMLRRLSRAEITTPPINGARIVAKVLGDKDLEQQWQNDLFHMRDRMRSMRERLVKALRKRQTPGSWDHILTDVSSCASLMCPALP
jgi:aspartate aminotransferase